MSVTADSVKYTADATWPSADGYVPANIIQADLSEPVGGHVTADSTAYTADASYPTADGGILAGALDFADAEVIAAGAAIIVEAAAAADILDAKVKRATGGGYFDIARRRPMLVTGRGYGMLPRLAGEAHGTVYIAAAGFAVLPIAGEAHGEVDDDDLLVMLLMLAA